MSGSELGGEAARPGTVAVPAPETCFLPWEAGEARAYERCKLPVTRGSWGCEGQQGLQVTVLECRLESDRESRSSRSASQEKNGNLPEVTDVN